MRHHQIQPEIFVDGFIQSLPQLEPATPDIATPAHIIQKDPLSNAFGRFLEFCALCVVDEASLVQLSVVFGSKTDKERGLLMACEDAGAVGLM